VKFIPTGGLFVTGGLTPKNIQHIEGQNSLFMKAYKDKGRVSPVLDTVPLFAVMVEDLGIR
jgi:glucokinase